MNYNEYNEQINLSDDLYEKTLAGVKSAVTNHNQVQKRRKTVFLSTAACFVVLACSVTAVKYLSKSSPSDALESTINMPIDNSNRDSNIIFNTEETKYPYKIIIDNKIYSQYYFGDEKGDKDNNIELKQSQIGELICEIDYFNITDDLSDFEPMSSEEAKTNKFYKAKTYKYTKAKSDNIIIVQAKNEYYLFYLDGLTNDYTIEELLNIYTADGANEIIGIEIWQDEFDCTFEDKEVRPLLKGILKDKDDISQILSILKKQYFKSRGYENHSSDYIEALNNYYADTTLNCPLMAEYGVYELRIKFSDGNDIISDRNYLHIEIEEAECSVFICQKGNVTCYSLENSDYDKLTEIIESSLL